MKTTSSVEQIVTVQLLNKAFKIIARVKHCFDAIKIQYMDELLLFPGYANPLEWI